MTTLRASYIRAYSVGLTNTCASQYAIAVIRVMCTSKDIEILNSREIEQYMPNYRVPTECQLASSSEQCTIDAGDGQTTHMCRI